nr:MULTISPECIES: CAP domain-containing protein [Bacillus]
MGQHSQTVQTALGAPDRRDLSFYDYEWWIYQDPENYIQVGIEADKVVTIYANGKDSNVQPFHIGQPIEEIYTSVLIEMYVNLEYDKGSYQFELSETDMNTRPLVKIGDYFAQLYIDKFTGSLSSVRYLDEKTLITHRPYELTYRGPLLEPKPLDETKSDLVEAGMEQQILDITNIIRSRHNAGPVTWDEKTAEVAVAHSKDMHDSGDFSHTSKTSGDLSDRLDAADVFYQLAGENIAANYIDAPEVVEGWLNSQGHRETLLNPDYTHLGVGVYERHYTQNFIQNWEK